MQTRVGKCIQDAIKSSGNGGLLVLYYHRIKRKREMQCSDRKGRQVWTIHISISAIRIASITRAMKGQRSSTVCFVIVRFIHWKHAREIIAILNQTGN